VCPGVLTLSVARATRPKENAAAEINPNILEHHIFGARGSKNYLQRGQRAESYPQAVDK
jgi:hypothetical protein